FVHQLVEHPDWSARAGESAVPAEPPLTQAMAALKRVARPGTLVLVLSDFTDFSRAAQSYLSGVARHSEVMAVFVNDPLERQLPPPGRYRVVSGEGEMSIDTHGRAARADYREAFRQREEALDAFCRRYGVHLLPLSTADDAVRRL